MKPRLAGGIQAAKRVGLIRNGTTGDSITALAVQLVRKFLVSEFTKPPAAQPAKMTGDRAWLEFISSMFNRDRTSKRLAEVIRTSSNFCSVVD
ncbi:hypothetical protein KIN20_019697 [Parelaphostrongylus tenuis]|uniref:Uncharacterized protein n=1 Tax=Parelaphostrongylus tenuis TaxID=148309 RepID=A0AAD5QT59_PARTN|nr:hypothetical protein KIN20_019697 [Parelaphostrongylus tenuis]